MKRILLFGVLCLSHIQRSEAIATEIVHDPTNFARQAEILAQTSSRVTIFYGFASPERIRLLGP